MSPGQRSLNPAIKFGGEGLVVAGSNAAVGRGNIDGVQLPPVRLIVVLILLDIGKLAAVRRERRVARSTLVTGLSSLRLGTVESDRLSGAVDLTEVNVASGVVGLVELRGLAEERVKLAIRGDSIVARVTERLDRGLGPGSSPIDAVVQVLQSRVGEGIAAVRGEGTGKHVVAVLGKPGIPVTNVDILVEATGVLRSDFGLRVDGSTVGVRHGVDQELDVSALSLSDLQTVVGSIQGSSQCALGRVVDVSDPQSDATGNLLVGSVDVDDTRVSSGDPGSLIDLADVKTRVLELARLQIKKSPA